MELQPPSWLKKGTRDPVGSESKNAVSRSECIRSESGDLRIRHKTRTSFLKRLGIVEKQPADDRTMFPNQETLSLTFESPVLKRRPFFWRMKNPMN
jgi:hypothetical protein